MLKVLLINIRMRSGLRDAVVVLIIVIEIEIIGRLALRCPWLLASPL